MRTVVSRAALGLSLVAAVPSFAHHSFAAHYLPDERQTIKGSVTRFEFRSPHSLLYLNVVAADGSKQSWMLEFGSALILNRLGWGPKTIAVGDVLEVVGMPSRTGATRLNVMELRRPSDGFEYKAKPGQ